MLGRIAAMPFGAGAGRAVIGKMAPFNRWATPTLMPVAVAVGRRGCSPTTGRVWVSCAGSIRWKKRDTGRDVVIVLLGTTVAARLLTRLPIAMSRLTAVKLEICATLTSRK
jgi:hypothetical protein